MMNRREKIMQVIRRERDDYIPFMFELCPSLKNKIMKETGGRDYREFYDMPYWGAELNPLKSNSDFSVYYKEFKQGTVFNEYGVGFEPSEGSHFTHMLHPMKNFEDLQQFKEYPYPDLRKCFDWNRFAIETEKLKKKDVITFGGPVSIFENAWYMRGMEELMMDMYTDDEKAYYHLERVTEIECERARLFAESGVDLIRYGDDVATQIDMMMSPEMWRKWLKSRLRRVIKAAKDVNPDIIIDFHSDGNVAKIIPDLIETGIEVLNPVQPECMDPIQMKEMYGGKIAFRGCIGTQTTMPFGSTEDVRNEVRRLAEKVGKGGGLILAPSHMLEPEVPISNVIAFVDELQKVNRELAHKQE